MDREQIREWIAQDWVKNPAGPSDTYVFIEDIHNLLAAIDELTAKSVVIDATVAAFAGDKSAVVRSLQARIDDLEAENIKLEKVVEAARRRRARGAPDHPIWAEFDAAIRSLDNRPAGEGRDKS